MDEPIEDVYFNWLYSKMASVAVPTPSLTYYTLFRELHSTEFVWQLWGDENRAEDGLELRREFQKQVQLDEDPPWMHIPCSILEMLIPLAKRAEFETGMSAREWFWIFLSNLRLNEFDDAHPGIRQRVAPILERFVWRTYRRNGHGGLFPLRHSIEDQRQVEIYYQFCAYLAELEEEGLL